jgi:hypothetical protein
VQRTSKPPLARTVSGGFSFWPAQLAASMITVRVLAAVLPQVSVATQQLFWLIVVDDGKLRAEI